MDNQQDNSIPVSGPPAAPDPGALGDNKEPLASTPLSPQDNLQAEAGGVPTQAMESSPVSPSDPGSSQASSSVQSEPLQTSDDLLDQIAVDSSSSAVPDTALQAAVVPPPAPPPAPPSDKIDLPAEEASIESDKAVTADVSGKKRFSKVYLLVFAVVSLLGVLGFLLWKFWPSGFLGLGKPGEIVWWGLWEEELVVNPLIEEYQKANPKVKVTYKKQSPQDYRERLTNSLARGEGPDIFRFHNTWVPMFKNELDPVPSSVMSPEEFANIYYPAIVADLASGSGFVGVPLGYDAITLYINEDIFESFNRTPPKTWDDFRKLAVDLTFKDEKGNINISGTALGRTENVDHWQEILALMMLENGVDLSRPTGTLASDAISFFKIFSTSDRIWNETLPPSTIAFANNKVAMYFGPTWRAFEIQQLNPNLRFRTVPVPQLPKDDLSEPDVSYATYWVEGVWQRSQNKDIAWDFLKFISSKESLEKLYQNAASTRLFGEPYPRIDMAPLLKDHPIVGSVIGLAPQAKSWYLVSRTFDGPTGLNSQISQYFTDAVNAKKPNLKTLADGITQVLSQYGLVSR